jgi:hypothetical protein
MTIPNLKPGWTATVEPTEDPTISKVSVMNTRTDGRERLYGVYLLAHYQDQNPIEVLFGACPQAFEP